MNLEEMTKEYGLACYGAIRSAIDKVTITWDAKTKNYLREQGYSIWVELVDGDLVVRACVCKGDTWHYTLYDDANIQREVQAALDTLDVRVVLNAMLAMKIENINQVTRWRIK
jgi:hypothetical protein|nr:MAG TPA: hypothetical protein [Caudoviricetes sp.]